MMIIREVELDDDGNIVALKGTVERIKITFRDPYLVEHLIEWATLELDYCGG